MKLPKNKSKPKSNISDYSILLYGREKIGKTTLCSQFPNSLFLMCEPGGKSLSIYQIPIHSWKDMIEAIKLLESDTRFDTIVVDTADIAFKYCEERVCEKLAISHPSEEEWGKGWGAVKDEFTRVMSRIQKLGKGVIFTSHSEEKEIRKTSGQSSDRTQPTLSKQGRRVLEPMVDLWAYYTYTPDGSRSLVVEGSANISAGSRIKGRFVGISSIDMGSSEEDAYRNLITAFNSGSVAEKIVGKKKVKIIRR